MRDQMLDFQFHYSTNILSFSMGPMIVAAVLRFHFLPKHHFLLFLLSIIQNLEILQDHMMTISILLIAVNLVLN